MSWRTYPLIFSPYLCGTIFTFILFTDLSSAREINIRAGNFEINPSFGISQEFSSNFFSEDNSSTERPDSEETTIYTPGLRIEYPGENFTFEFDYRSDIKRNRYFSDENTEDQDVFIGFGLISPGQRLKLTLSNQFLDTKDPSSIDIRSAANLNRADRVENRVNAIVELKFSELFKLIFDISHESDEFDKSAFATENTQTVIYKSSLFYRILPKTSATIVYEVEAIKYPEANAILTQNFNTLTQSVRTGLSFDATAKLSGDATIGYTRKKPTQSDTGALTKFQSESTFGVDVDLTWAIRERTKLTIGVERSIDDAITGTGSSITRNNFALGLSQNILNKFTLDLASIFTKSDYDKDVIGRERNDNLYGFGISFAYDIQEWISMSISYQYENNLSNSNFNNNEYRNNEWVFNINALF